MCRARDPVTGWFSVPLQLGLFASALFKKKDFIAPFRGDLISLEEAEHRTAAGQGGYQIRVSRTLVLDCFRTSRDLLCMASFANSSHNLWNLATDAKAQNNAKLCISYEGSPPRLSVCLRAICMIFPNQEILFPYQSGYRFPLIPDSLPCPIELIRSTAIPQPSPPPTLPKRSIVTFSKQELIDLRRRPTTPRLAILRHMERKRLDTLSVLSFTPADQFIVAESAKIATMSLLMLFPNGPQTVVHVRRVLEAAHRASSTIFGTTAAQSWGDNYQFPDLLLTRDTEALQAVGFSLPALARQRRADSLSVSFSRDRVLQSFGMDGSKVAALSATDFQRLLCMADFGVSLPVPTRFSPIADPAPLRAKYIQVKSAVHKTLAKQIELGSALLLPLQLARTIPHIHLQNSQHWTTKKDKPAGRIIADLSNTRDPLTICPLNGFTQLERANLTERCVEQFGPIKLPTIQELMLMVLDLADCHGWANISLWKMDLKGAFNLLWFDPEQVALLAFPLTDALVVIHLVGIFGWLGMPFAFNVLSRALLVLILSVITGRADMYVDDVMGCSATVQLDSDMSAARSAIVGLAGDDSIAPDKVEQGRCLEFIGWVICLDSQTVSASPRLLLKTTQALFCFHVDDRVSQLHLQRLASLTSRLSLLCSYMRPFTRHLAIESAQFQLNPNARHLLSAAAKAEVWMWRSFLLILQAPGYTLYKRISSFRPRTPTFELHYDASLTQIAVGLYTYPGDSRVLKAFTAPMLPFTVSSDSSRQNTCEFLAVVLGLVLAATLDIRDASYTLFGDSVSSLAWATSGRVASTLAARANLALAALSVQLNADVADTVHVPGKLNTVYDGLSRGKTAEEVGLPPALQVFFPDTHPAAEILALCDPSLPMPAALEITSLIGRFVRLVRKITNPVI